MEAVGLGLSAPRELDVEELGALKRIPTTWLRSFTGNIIVLGVADGVSAFFGLFFPIVAGMVPACQGKNRPYKGDGTALQSNASE